MPEVRWVRFVEARRDLPIRGGFVSSFLARVEVADEFDLRMSASAPRNSDGARIPINDGGAAPAATQKRSARSRTRVFRLGNGSSNPFYVARAARMVVQTRSASVRVSEPSSLPAPLFRVFPCSRFHERLARFQQALVRAREDAVACDEGDNRGIKKGTNPGIK